MLAHQLRALGLTVDVLPWQAVAAGPASGDPAGLLDAADLVVPGPGPGDPTSGDDPKMVTLRRVLAGLLASGRPVLAVCLSHQLLADLLGLPLFRRASTYQGLQREVDLFGQARRVGFYSTFAARADRDQLATPYGSVLLACDPEDRAVHALRGATFAGVQFHPESALSRDGLAVLTDLINHLIPVPTDPAPVAAV
jgi:phenazine biosynthesis protein phzE